MEQSISTGQNDLISLNNFIILNKETLEGHAIININGGYKIEVSKEPEVLKFLINKFSETIKISKQHDNDKIIINVFLDNYHRKNIRKEFIITITKVLINIFPDNLEQCNILNPSHIFRDILKIIKSFLQPVTRKRIFIKNVEENCS